MKRSALTNGNANVLTRKVAIEFSDEDTLTVEVRMTVLATALREDGNKVLKAIGRVQELSDSFVGDAVDEDTVAASVVELEKIVSALGSKVAKLLAKILKSWDLVDEEDNAIACTHEVLKTFDPMELIVIFGALVQEIQSDPKGTSKS